MFKSEAAKEVIDRWWDNPDVGVIGVCVWREGETLKTSMTSSFGDNVFTKQEIMDALQTAMNEFHKVDEKDQVAMLSRTK